MLDIEREYSKIMKAKVTRFKVDNDVVVLSKVDPLTVWKYKDKLLAGGLFRLHDEKGFSLTDSLRECHKHHIIPCLDEFRRHAAIAGWSHEKIERTISEAQADSQSWATAS